MKAQINKMARIAAKKGVQNYARNYFLRVFKAFMTYCIDYHDINMMNPCKGIKPLSIEIIDKYIPSNQEIELAKANCNAGQKLLIDVVWQTGARINEIMNLRAEHIDWQNNRMTLFTKKSKNQNRTLRKIRIPDCLTEASIDSDLGKDDVYKLPTKGYIFPQFRTHPKFIEKFHRDNNIEKRWSWHNLRHKWTVEAAQKGTPLLMIMYNLGHSSSATTDRYLRSLSIPVDDWADDWVGDWAEPSADSAYVIEF